jgi:hypothetical protein
MQVMSAPFKCLQMVRAMNSTDKATFFILLYSDLDTVELAAALAGGLNDTAFERFANMIKRDGWLLRRKAAHDKVKEEV